MIIIPLTKEYEAGARDVILEGLEERFGFIDPTFNPDLKNLIESYAEPANLFLIGLGGEEVVATGALTKDGTEARIQRMSVKKEFRRHGLAKLMLSTWRKKPATKAMKKSS